MGSESVLNCVEVNQVRTPAPNGSLPEGAVLLDKPIYKPARHTQILKKAMASTGWEDTWVCDMAKYFSEIIINGRWGYWENEYTRSKKPAKNGEYYINKPSPKELYYKAPGSWDPALILPHISGEEIIYYRSTELYCIDIDNKHNDEAGLKRLSNIIDKFFPANVVYKDKSRSGNGLHYYIKCSHLGIFRLIVDELHKHSQHCSSAVIDKVVCGSEDQCVNIPFIKSEGDWNKLNSLPVLGYNSLKTIYDNIKNYNNKYWPEVIEVKEEVKPTTAVIKTYKPKKNMQRLLAAIAKNPFSQGAFYGTMFVGSQCKNYGYNKDEFNEIYKQHVSIDGQTDDGKLDRAWEIVEANWKPQFAKKVIKSYFELPSKVIHTLARKLRNRLEIGSHKSEGMAAWLWMLYNSHDCGVAESQFIKTCKINKDEGKLDWTHTSRSYDTARKLCSEMGVKANNDWIVGKKSQTYVLTQELITLIEESVKESNNKINPLCLTRLENKFEAESEDTYEESLEVSEDSIDNDVGPPS